MITSLGAPPSTDFLSVRTRLGGRTVVTVVAVAAVVVVASSAVAWDGSVAGWEAAPLRWIVAWPDWFEPALWLVQQFGIVFTPIVAGIVVVSFTRRWRHLAPFVSVLPLKLILEKAIVKQLVDRERPYTALGGEIDVRGSQLAGFSFPSGHATTAAATAVLVAAFLPPRWRPLPFAVAVGVGVARLYHGEHNLLDVVAGAALGIALGVVLWFAFLDRDATVEAAGVETVDGGSVP